MNSFMVAFGLASIALCIGVLLRAKIPFFRNMLVPASVIAGFIGAIFMNLVPVLGFKIGTDGNMFTQIVNYLFTISFISISLTSTSKGEGNTTKNTAKGSFGMGMVWCLLYALTPLVGCGIIWLVGRSVSMDSIYGTLIQFAFCQGPGQAVVYGSMYEGFGWENAAMVAVAFAVVGFVVAFAVGIPMAKIGVKRGIAKNCGKIDESLLKGYLRKEEQSEYMVKDTTCNSNIETLTFHFALIGLCYVIALGIAKVLSFLPGFLGPSLSGLMFMNGMYAAYIVKFIMKKLNLDFLLENTLQTKITGWTADYLVVCAFMAVSVNIIGKWMMPILVEAIVVTVITTVVCLYFGQRFGGSNDFERTLGLYGTCTGTVPSGIALVRIVDSGFKTSTSVELGLMNLVMIIFCTPVYLLLLGMADGAISMGKTMLVLAAISVAYLVILKVTRCWGKKSFSWKKQS